MSETITLKEDPLGSAQGPCTPHDDEEYRMNVHRVGKSEASAYLGGSRDGYEPYNKYTGTYVAQTPQVTPSGEPTTSVKDTLVKEAKESMRVHESTIMLNNSSSSSSLDHSDIESFRDFSAALEQLADTDQPVPQGSTTATTSTQAYRGGDTTIAEVVPEESHLQDKEDEDNEDTDLEMAKRMFSDEIPKIVDEDINVGNWNHNDDDDDCVVYVNRDDFDNYFELEEQENEVESRLPKDYFDPSAWRCASTKDGKLYYYHHRLRQAVWTLPEGISSGQIIFRGSYPLRSKPTEKANELSKASSTSIECKENFIAAAAPTTESDNGTQGANEQAIAQDKLGTQLSPEYRADAATREEYEELQFAPHPSEENDENATPDRKAVEEELGSLFPSNEPSQSHYTCPTPNKPDLQRTYVNSNVFPSLTPAAHERVASAVKTAREVAELTKSFSGRSKASRSTSRADREKTKSDISDNEDGHTSPTDGVTLQQSSRVQRTIPNRSSALYRKRNVAPKRKTAPSQRPGTHTVSRSEGSSNRKASHTAPLEQVHEDKEQCPHCNRKFAPGRLEVHEPVCERVFIRKRHQYDTSSRRLKHTPAEKFHEFPLTGQSAYTSTRKTNARRQRSADSSQKRSTSRPKVRTAPANYRVGTNSLKKSQSANDNLRNIRGRNLLAGKFADVALGDTSEQRAVEHSSAAADDYGLSERDTTRNLQEEFASANVSQQFIYPNDNINMETGAFSQYEMGIPHGESVRVSQKSSSPLKYESMLKYGNTKAQEERRGNTDSESDNDDQEKRGLSEHPSSPATASKEVKRDLGQEFGYVQGNRRFAESMDGATFQKIRESGEFHENTEPSGRSMDGATAEKRRSVEQEPGCYRENTAAYDCSMAVSQYQLASHRPDTELLSQGRNDPTAVTLPSAAGEEERAKRNLEEEFARTSTHSYQSDRGEGIVTGEDEIPHGVTAPYDAVGSGGNAAGISGRYTSLSQSNSREEQSGGNGTGISERGISQLQNNSCEEQSDLGSPIGVDDIVSRAPVRCDSCGTRLTGAAELCRHLIQCSPWLNMIKGCRSQDRLSATDVKKKLDFSD
eukprot:gb/GECG01012470.1/.p1 GENE.gb/GECG01012470.1/~~gb/GECG01012470.1/.p1  ORF type:complete len:1080 (+),score=169.73 gb/GECG01012470.1/:1-3240(+)